ncbi:MULTISPECIES: hypothetical protein [Bacillus subtilis group]|uniref:hypothetical protein n=1 Tax=Bacillus amyloliquefaciens group TaxID=1938374 RepID=UPI001B8E1021|nr:MULTISPECIES: hypothetical protein [Bacillus subtilis group]MEC5261238.1 hypothetical protein [Bacillus amyloliquefaciens]MED0777918.1 hypothetical protein [Bacillus siamensis]MED0780795.1 hypothetical protein [Bacillus siamensis]MED0833614.1 hypothetical protein [Bacillus siamensis]CAF1771937.1 hypothetical protein NRS6120_02180 [Bacillus subtilis]
MKKTEFDYLNGHLATLTRLREAGYKCDQEISQVLRCLHKKIFENATPDFPKNSRATLSDVDAELQEKFHLYAPKLVLVYEDDRGKGKTTLLMKFSEQNSIPVIVGTNTEGKIYKHLGEEKGISCVVIPANRLLGEHLPNGVYIDSTVTKEQLKTIKELGIEIKGGFHQDEVLSSLV